MLTASMHSLLDLDDLSRVSRLHEAGPSKQISLA
jgi:hypothetical protein